MIGNESPIEAKQRKHFGFVPQSPALLEWKTVRDNVRLLRTCNGPANASGAASATSSTLIDRVGLTDAADRHAPQLSGGMQQRVSLARAFALRAPYSSWTNRSRRSTRSRGAEMRFLLLRAVAGDPATVLFVTHNIDDAIVLSDRVVVLAGRPERWSPTSASRWPEPRHEGIEDDPRVPRPRRRPSDAHSTAAS